LVGETGGRDFVLAHESADPQALAVALLRGVFEYQGQKCGSGSSEICGFVVGELLVHDRAARRLHRDDQ
jgi:acyl-CoA reductase-like NAD-dependent aldehyde dehydrogenase